MKSLLQRTFAMPFVIPTLPVLVVLLACVQPLLADEFMDISDIKECRMIEAKAERLLCYDTVVDGGVFNEQQLQQVQAENFGSNKKEVDISVDILTVTIVRVQKDAYGIHYFYTSDGKVWKQGTRGSWSLKPPFEAELKSGVLGSFFLVAKDSHSIRVKRVK